MPCAGNYRNDLAEARLQSLVEKAAQGPGTGLIWLSEPEGAAKDGLFTRTAPPAFTFHYPLGSRKINLHTPYQVMRMRTPGDVVFSTSIQAQPPGIPLADMGSQAIVSRLEKMSSQIRVVANQALTLRDGTPAYRTDIQWILSQGSPSTSVFVSAFKADKWVLLAAHPIWQEPQDIVPMVESLTFREAQK